MELSLLSVLGNNDVLFLLAKAHLAHHPNSTVSLVASCSQLWNMSWKNGQSISIGMQALPQTSLCHWPLFTQCRYAWEGLSLEMHTLRSGDLATIGECLYLRSLDLSRCGELTTLEGLANCASLHTLDLSLCHALTDVSAIASCQSLHTLDLSHCHLLGDVVPLSKCLSLHALNLTLCGNLLHVGALGQCASLCMLDLTGCSRLVDITADIADLQKCASLHSLILPYQLKFI